MGKLYQVGSPPPQKPSGGNPMMWALMGGSVVMVFMAIIVALVLKLRAAEPAQTARSAAAQAGEPAADDPTSGDPTNSIPAGQYAPPPAPRGQYPANRSRRLRSRTFRNGGPRSTWATPTSSFPTPGPTSGPAQNVAPAAALPPSQYLPQQGYTAPLVRTAQAPRVPTVGGAYGARTPSSYQPAAAYGGGSPQDVIARVKGSVLLILAEGPEGLGSGTGFVVSGYQVATCAHVVEGSRRIQLFSPDGRRYRATVANMDRMSDVAVLTVSSSLPPPLSLGSYNQARDGDDVAVTGYPQMFSMLSEGFSPTPSTSRGSISAKRVQSINGMAVPQIQTDAAINPGNSGGPLYSLRDGTVYGLAASLLSGSQGMNFASSVDALRRLLGR